ncbi:MAG: glycosyltransferase family 2 protein [Syntrophorhabdaceae bacterium]|nr:glycosyltransferase family 2 protein [Syntrophorhabdaceae bacterium]
MAILDLSICMITWNAIKLTGDCIKSIIDKTKGITYEIILVDNGSSDGTVEFIRENYPEVKLIVNEKNEGFTYANNQALKVSRGRYAILLNNDMVLKEDALTKMVRFLDAHPDIGALGCRLKFPDGTIQHTAHGDARWQDLIYAAFYLYRIFPKSREFGHMDCSYLNLEDDTLVADVGWVAGAALMVRQDAIKKAGLMDERIFIFSDDWEWCQRIARTGYRVVYYAGAEIIHFHGQATTAYTGSALNEVRKKSILRFTATAMYVFRRLNGKSPVKILLFDLSYRLFCLSRAIVNGIRCIIKPQKGLKGIFKGYALSVFMPRRNLFREYLRPL